MCWFSAEHASYIEEAKAGERLAIRTMSWHANWVVRDTELETPKPCPVCLKDRTRVLFRLSEDQQAKLQLGPETEGVFRMLKQPKRDVFEFADGREISVNNLPAGLILDVLVVPGSEQLSAVLEMEPAVKEKDREKDEEKDEEEREKEPILVRLLGRF